MVIMSIIVAESMLASRCDFVDEFVGAIAARLNYRGDGFSRKDRSLLGAIFAVFMKSLVLGEEQEE
jgi:hypothetical protein